MKWRHQQDLRWRFQDAALAEVRIPSASLVLQRWAELEGATGEPGEAPSLSDAHMAALERAARIDAALARLPAEPDLQRVLVHAYSDDETLVVFRRVLPDLSRVATMTEPARRWFERVRRTPPRSRSDDVRLFLEGICARATLDEATVTDKLVLSEVRGAAERLRLEAENAYEAIADRYDRRTRGWAA